LLEIEVSFSIFLKFLNNHKNLTYMVLLLLNLSYLANNRETKKDR